MTATIAEMADSETRQQLTALRTFLQGKEDKDRKFRPLKKGEPRYAPSKMSDKDYVKWKRGNREISKLYK